MTQFFWVTGDYGFDETYFAKIFFSTMELKYAQLPKG